MFKWTYKSTANFQFAHVLHCMHTFHFKSLQYVSVKHRCVAKQRLRIGLVRWCQPSSVFQLVIRFWSVQFLSFSITLKELLLYATLYASPSSTHCLNRPYFSACKTNLTYVYGFRPDIEISRFHHVLKKPKTGCQCRREFNLKQPAVDKPPGKVNMAEDVNCGGCHYTGREHACRHISGKRAATSYVPAQIATPFGKNDIKENYFKCAAKPFRWIKREASSRLLERVLSFLQTSVLTSFYQNRHLCYLRACWKRHDKVLRQKLNFLQMKLLSVLCDTEDESEKQHVIF